MEFWNYINENSKVLQWIIIGLINLVCFVILLRKLRVRRLLKTVTSYKRGTKTERLLVLQLLQYGIPAQTIFHDLFIEKSDGKFAQIDLVVATTEGIIVFEVKDYSGWIYGNGNYSQWTKVLAYGKRKYHFYNPIKQNTNHIKSLKKQLRQFDNIPFFSVIVFYGDCELKEINYVPKDTFLVKHHRIFEVLKHIKQNNEAAPYTNKKEVLGMLQQAVKNGENKSNQERHVEDINDLLGKDRIFD